MRISELGEFGLIARVQRWTQEADAPAGAPFQLTVANGDDAAAVTFPHGPVTELYTTDTMVDGIHFTASTTPWRDLGWKAIASNISDVAAMGGAPGVALITLGLPPDTLVSDVKDLYAGMTAICREYGASIVGGDMVRSPTAFITVALTGIAPGEPMLRTCARPGHLVAVTGPVGGSAGGLQSMLAPSAHDASLAGQLIARHRRPYPHIAAGQTLAAAGVRSAMDVSDGLADDLGKLCSASGVAATIRAESVPAEPALKAAFPEEWLDLALYGGEDYVLLFTAPPGLMTTAMSQLPAGAAIVGEIAAGPPGTVTVVNRDGSPRSRSGAGWDHFTG